NLYRELRRPRYLLCLGPQIFVLARKEDRLHVQFSANKFLKDGRDIPPSDPAGVNEDRELIGIEVERPTCLLSVRFSDLAELGMHWHSRDLDPVLGHAVIHQLALGVFVGDQIKRHVVTGPSLPEAIARVRHYRYERYLVGKIKLTED